MEPPNAAGTGGSRGKCRDSALSADRDGLGKETRAVQIVDAGGTVIDTVIVPGDGQGDLRG